MYEVSNVVVSYGAAAAVADVRLRIDAGELVVVVGPNGAGKSTLINAMAGLHAVASGRLLVDGRDITREAPHRIARLGLARTFQHGELFGQLSVAENLLVARHSRISTQLIAEGLRTPGVRAAEAAHREAVERVLDFTDLERHRHEVVGELPFGLQKIVGFARALAMEPKLLLLDEPSAGLNREEREDLARYILRIKHELGIAMIWVEHDMQMVADLADRIFVLNHGVPLAEGTPEAVLNDPAVVAAYLGNRPNS